MIPQTKPAPSPGALVIHVRPAHDQVSLVNRVGAVARRLRWLRSCRRSAVLLLVGCCSWNIVVAADPVLLFRSGFEEGSTVLDRNGQPAASPAQARDMAGVDQTTGYDWAADLVSDNEEPRRSRLGNYNVLINAAENGAGVSIINDPTGSGRGRVMEFRLQTPAKKGRVQTNVYGSAKDLNEVTCAVRMYLHPDLKVLEDYPERMSWFTIQELWTAPVWQNEGRNFRITLALKKAEGPGNPLVWAVHSDEAGKGGTTFWDEKKDANQVTASQFLGQWVTTVMYYRKGDADTGRFRFKLVKEDGTQIELFNITNWTHHPTDPDQNTGLTHHSPQKLYGPSAVFDWVREHSQDGNGAAIIYWDDLEYWEGDAYTNYLAATYAK